MEEKVNIHFYHRTIKDLRENKELGFDDPEGILNCLNENVKQTFLNNPSLETDEDVCQIIALDGNRVIGTEMTFPNRYAINGEEKLCRGASTLFVSERYRKYMIGTDIMLQGAAITPKQDSIVAGISQIAYPIYKAMRYSCFSFPRFIVLLKSRCVIESKLGGPNIFSKIISSSIDSCLWLHKRLICNLAPLRKYSIKKVNKTPPEVEDIVLEDEHPYKELHDRKWFDWNLMYSFKSQSENNKYMNVIMKGNDIVAFYVVKIEFFAEAGSSGYKNIKLATIAEWGIKRSCSLRESELHLMAIKNITEDVDGIQIATTEPITEKKYRKYCFFPMGIANNAVFMKSTKDKEIKKQQNWRLRIAASDTLLN